MVLSADSVDGAGPGARLEPDPACWYLTPGIYTTVTAKYLAEEQGGKLTYPVACGLDEVRIGDALPTVAGSPPHRASHVQDFMRTLGIYISNPKNYQPQTHSFAEPAYFVLDEQSVIKYRCESSHPMGGRPDVDAILAGYNWSQQNAVEHPEYKVRVLCWLACWTSRGLMGPMYQRRATSGVTSRPSRTSTRVYEAHRSVKIPVNQGTT